MKKVTKWLHTRKYVDQQTGEQITEHEAKTKYIIERRKKHIRYEHSINKRTHNRDTTGYIEWTIECTRNGRQINIWEDGND